MLTQTRSADTYLAQAGPSLFAKDAEAGVDCRLCPARETKFPQDAPNVIACCMFADDEPCGNLPISNTLGSSTTRVMNPATAAMISHAR